MTPHFFSAFVSQVSGRRHGVDHHGGPANAVVNSALKYRAAQPVIDGLLGEVGLEGGGELSQLLGAAVGATGKALAAEAVGEEARVA